MECYSHSKGLPITWFVLKLTPYHSDHAHLGQEVTVWQASLTPSVYHIEIPANVSLTRCETVILVNGGYIFQVHISVYSKQIWAGHVAQLSSTD